MCNKNYAAAVEVVRQGELGLSSWFLEDDCLEDDRLIRQRAPLFGGWRADAGGAGNDAAW